MHVIAEVRKVPDSKLREINIDKLFDIIGTNKGTAILTACDSDEVALEKSEIEHGIFTYHLINILENINSKNNFADFNEVYNQILKIVRENTDNKQNPQAKCSDDNFKILTLPKTNSTETKNIQFDTSLIPTSKIPKPSEHYLPEKLDDIEKQVIQLIQENRFIEVDILIKEILNKIFLKISTPEVSLHAEPNEAISYYESCREHLKPLIILMEYVLEYYEPKYIEDNIDYVFKFEQLVHGKSGNVAIIEIPLLIISEIIFKLIPIAYKKGNSNILRKLLTYTIDDTYGGSKPIIYDIRIWQSYLFNNSIDSYFKYIFPETTDKDFTFNSNIDNLNEITFLLDCYSENNEFYLSYPTYIIFNDIYASRRIISKLSDQKFVSFVESIFEIKMDDFLKLIIKRQKNILEWTGLSYGMRSSMSKILTEFEEFGLKTP